MEQGPLRVAGVLAVPQEENQGPMLNSSVSRSLQVGGGPCGKVHSKLAM